MTYIFQLHGLLVVWSYIYFTMRLIKTNHNLRNRECAFKSRFGVLCIKNVYLILPLTFYVYAICFGVALTTLLIYRSPKGNPRKTFNSGDGVWGYLKSPRESQGKILGIAGLSDESRRFPEIAFSQTGNSWPPKGDPLDTRVESPLDPTP